MPVSLWFEAFTDILAFPVIWEMVYAKNRMAFGITTSRYCLIFMGRFVRGASFTFFLRLLKRKQ
jgi:hypothetical protein